MAQRSHLREVFGLRDTNGDFAPVQNARCFVYKLNTTTPISDAMYSALSGGSVMANPLTTDILGQIDVWLNIPGTDCPGYVTIVLDDNNLQALINGKPTGAFTQTKIVNLQGSGFDQAGTAGAGANDTVDSAGAAGTLGSLAVQNHGHQLVTTAGPGAAVTVGAAAPAGTTGTVGRSDHGHRVDPDAGGGANISIDAAGTAGSATALARGGHGHDLVTYSAVPAAPVQGGAAGNSGDAPSRGSHAHPIPAVIGNKTDADQLITNTTVATAVVGADVTIGANTIAQGSRFRIHVSGKYDTGTTNKNIVITLRWGGTGGSAILTDTIVTSSGQTAIFLGRRYDMVFRSATSAIATETQGGTQAPVVTGLSTNTPQNLTVEIHWVNTGDVGNIVTIRDAHIQQVA